MDDRQITWILVLVGDLTTAFDVMMAVAMSQITLSGE